MRFHGTFDVHYEADDETLETGTVTVKAHGGYPELEFRHSVQFNMTPVRVPRVHYRVGDVDLATPMIYAASAQAAMGEAVKVAVDRVIADNRTPA